MRDTVPALVAAAVLATAGCTRTSSVQPYGTVAEGNRVRTLPARDVVPVDDFLNRHRAELGILATPANPSPAIR